MRSIFCVLLFCVIAAPSVKAQTIGEIVFAFKSMQAADNTIAGLARRYGGDVGCSFVGARPQYCNSTSRCLSAHSMVRNFVNGGSGAARKLCDHYGGASTMYDRCIGWIAGWPTARTNGTSRDIERSICALAQAEDDFGSRREVVDATLNAGISNDDRQLLRKYR